MGGNDKKVTTDTYSPPSWVEGASRQAIDLGQKIGNQKYESYRGKRVAGLSENEQEGISRAGSASSYGRDDFNNASKYAERGTQQFGDANMQDYMNPYIKSALDPAAREIGEAGQRRENTLDAKASSMDAFGGSGAALQRSENSRNTIESISDLYGRGYAAAYESAVGIWGDERARDLQAAGRFESLGQSRVSAANMDVSSLMATGAIDRGVDQDSLDFDYKQFTEERDWDFRNLAGLISSIQGTKGSYSTTQTSTTENQEDKTAETVGMIMQVVAAMYSDERLKDNIIFAGMYMGHKLYTWTWNALAKSLGINTPEFGVIAQQVQHTGCVSEHSSGYLMVNYRRLFGEAS